MALQNLYADPNVAADGFSMTSRSRNVRQGNELMLMTSSIAIGATDNANSVYRMFKNLDANFVPVEIRLANTAMAALVIDIGLYKANLSLTQAPAVGGQEIFLNAKDISAGVASLAPGVAWDGLETYWAAFGYTTQLDKRLFEIAGDSLAPNAAGVITPRQYDLCITATTPATVAGTLAMVLIGYQG